jgi:hypothetical protein
MTLFSSLDPRDRKLLSICLVSVAVLAVVTGVFARNQNRDDNPMPSSYLTGRHGARAAYEMLEASGYIVERWEQPLGDLVARANAQTVLIIAEPLTSSRADTKAVDEIVKRGARVLVTGAVGGQLVPDGAVQPSRQFQMAACKLAPEGLAPLAASGDVWMQPAAVWKLSSPRYHVDYTCAGQPAVVEYNVGAGSVVWWASSTPFENGSIGRDGDLSLFLNSLGARGGHRIYWDESLHGEVASQWFYARGAALNLLLAGLGAIGLLVIFSFSRRSGPVRDLPQPPRASPIEFLQALGSLYSKAGASATAVSLAYARFRRKMGELCGLNGMQMNAEELSIALRRRFPQASAELDADLAACEEASMNDKLIAKRALAMVQMLHRHAALLTAAARMSRNGLQRSASALAKNENTIPSNDGSR